MNPRSTSKNITGQICAMALAIVASAAFARTVTVDSVFDGSVTVSFGDEDGMEYALAWCYGASDGGAATNTWDSFETLGVVAANATSQTFAVPSGWGTSVAYMRFFLLGPNLPDGATHVEYLESTGSQFIDTGIRGKVGITAEVDVMWTDSADKTLLGSRNGSTHRFFVVHNNRCHLGFGLDGEFQYWTPAANTSYNTRYVVRSAILDGSQTCTLDGLAMKNSYTLGGNSFDSGNDMYLFACNDNGSVCLGTSARVYSAKIWEGDTLARWFVPCRDNNGNLAMFDCVSGGFFYNGASTALLSGSATPNPIAASTTSAAAADYGEPDAYLDYIESTGEQYIDTGVRAKTGLKVRADFSWEGSISTKTDWGLVGARDDKDNPNSYRMLMVHMFNQMPFVGYGKDSRGNPSNSTNFTSGVRGEVVTDFSDPASLDLYQNGAKTFSASNLSTYSAHGEIDIGFNLYLFAYNLAGTATGKSKAKLYGLKILRKNGSGFDVVRNFLPAKKNGVAGLYDKASGCFFKSETSADFTAGPELPRPAQLVKWVESDAGTNQWINTRVIAKSGLNSDIDFTLKDDPYTATDRGILSSRGAAGSGTRFFLAYHLSANFVYGYKSLYSAHNETAADVDAVQGERYRIVSDLSEGNQSVLVNGTELNTKGSTSTGYFTTGNPLTLFCYSETEGSRLFSAVRLYSLKIGDGDEPLRDYIPCVADNGKAGLYDRVSERVFFPVSGKYADATEFDLATKVGAATNFTAEAGLPTVRLSYAESDGIDDYVDLGVEAKDGTRMVADLSWTVLPDDDVFCGARIATSGEQANTRFFLYNAYDSPLHAMGYGSGNATVSGNIGNVETNVRYRIDTTLDNGSQTCSVRKSVNGAWTTSTRTANFSGPIANGIPLYLFARNLGGAPDCFAGARVYSLKLWQKDGSGNYQLVRNLVPVKDSRGVVALWDCVDERYYYSGGSYSLSGGAERPFSTGMTLIIH